MSLETMVLRSHLAAAEDQIKALEEKLDRTPIDWDTEIDALQRANDALRVEVERLKTYEDAFIDMGKECERLRAEVERLQRCLDRSVEQANEYRAEVDGLADTVVDREKRWADCRAEVERLKDCAAVGRKTMETKDRNLDHLRAEVARLTGILVKMTNVRDARVAELEAEVAALEADLQNDGQWVALRAEVERLKADTWVQSPDATLRAEVERLRARVAELEEALREILRGEKAYPIARAALERKPCS